MYKKSFYLIVLVVLLAGGALVVGFVVMAGSSEPRYSLTLDLDGLLLPDESVRQSEIFGEEGLQLVEDGSWRFWVYESGTDVRIVGWFWGESRYAGRRVGEVVERFANRNEAHRFYVSQLPRNSPRTPWRNFTEAYMVHPTKADLYPEWFDAGVLAADEAEIACGMGGQPSPTVSAGDGCVRF